MEPLLVGEVIFAEWSDKRPAAPSRAGADCVRSKGTRRRALRSARFRPGSCALASQSAREWTAFASR